ncbi:gas vesicle protein [Streptomyces sp. NBC_01017]|uniref:Gas vesicle protein n=2 Tax=Streptomyces TaxID=1883 RepID=A0ABU8UKH6_9ACTN|nr:gas vesicle protein [Streptomyces sp. NBC_01017]
MITSDREPRKAHSSARQTSDGARMSAAAAIRSAMEQLSELLGRAPESVSSLKPTDQGWEADVEVLELERIPETTSVMASYQVVLDQEGQLVSYKRGRRYTRSQVDRPDRR